MDIDGQTPLHLATIAGNLRIIRGLLYKGSARNVSDNKGRTPMSLAEENQATSIAEVLKEPGCLSGCGIKQPVRPFKNYYTSLIAYFVFFIGGNILNLLFVVGAVGSLLTAVYILTML